MGDTEMTIWNYLTVIAIGLVAWIAAYYYGVWYSRNA